MLHYSIQFPTVKYYLKCQFHSRYLTSRSSVILGLLKVDIQVNLDFVLCFPLSAEF